MHILNLVKFYQLVFKILCGNQILCHNSGTNFRIMMCNNPNLDLVNMNAYIKFGENMSSCSQDIECNKISAYIKGHNSGTNLQARSCQYECIY